MNIRSFWQDLAKIFMQTKCLLLPQEIRNKLLNKELDKFIKENYVPLKAFKAPSIQFYWLSFQYIGLHDLQWSRLPRSLPNADQCRSKFWHWSRCRSIPTNADRHLKAFRINAMILNGVDQHWHWLRESWMISYSSVLPLNTCMYL